MENQTVITKSTEIIKNNPEHLHTPAAHNPSKMEFRFDVNPYFKSNIIKVNSNLLPVGFNGDRRTLL